MSSERGKLRIEYSHATDSDWHLWSYSRKKWNLKRTEKSADRLQKAYPRRMWRVVQHTLLHEKGMAHGGD